MDRRYERMHELNQLTQRLDKLLRLSGPAASLRKFAGDNLEVDMYEMDDAVVIEAPLPGLPAKDTEVETQNGYLTIRAG